VATLLLFAAACTPGQKETVATHRPPPDVQKPAVGIETPGARKPSFLVEIATSPRQREVGLMFRKELPDNTGMLFIFEQEEDHHFWMKNTYIPLDMIFIGGDMAIVGIVHSAAPESTRSLSVGKPSRYVLEINGGLARKEGIAEGQRVTFRGFAPP
jgi:hypothetical protein